MRSVARFTVLNLAFVAMGALPAGAQSAGVMGDLMSDVAETEKKFIALAKEIPASSDIRRALEAITRH